MASRLLTALSIADSTGTDVSLMSDPVRKVTKASGLVGISAREVIVKRSGRSGSRSLTRYRNDSQIVIEGLLKGGNADDTWNQYDVLAGALSDAIDTDRVLKWTSGETLQLQRNVFLSSLEGPIEVGPDLLRYQATFRGADPNVYSQLLRASISRPLGSVSAGGMKFPLKFPFTFRAPATTAAAFENSGFISTPPILQIYGRLVNPIVRLTSDLEMVFNGVIGEDDFLVVDVDKRTVMLNGEINNRSMLVTSQSVWFELPKGPGTVSLISIDFSANAHLALFWRDARA